MTKALNVVTAVTELAQSYETEREKVAILEGEVTRLTKEQATTRELNAELRRLNDSLRRNVEQARKELADQEAVRSGDERNYQRVLDCLQPYKDKVGLHERNIEAIQKELSKLR